VYTRAYSVVVMELLPVSAENGGYRGLGLVQAKTQSLDDPSQPGQGLFGSASGDDHEIIRVVDGSVPSSGVKASPRVIPSSQPDHSAVGPSSGSMSSTEVLPWSMAAMDSALK